MVEHALESGTGLQLGRELAVRAGFEDTATLKAAANSLKSLDRSRVEVQRSFEHEVCLPADEPFLSGHLAVKDSDLNVDVELEVSPSC